MELCDYRMCRKYSAFDVMCCAVLQAVQVMEHGSPEAKLEWLFQLHDIDGNGSIDKMEMLEIVKTAYAIQGANHPSESMEARLNNTFSRSDANCDGKLTKAEFVTSCQVNQDLCYTLIQSAASLVTGLRSVLVGGTEKKFLE